MGYIPSLESELIDPLALLPQNLCIRLPSLLPTPFLDQLPEASDASAIASDFDADNEDLICLR